MRSLRVHRQVIGAIAAALAVIISCLALSAPASAASPPTIVEMAAGTAHTCAIYSDTTVKCWGANAYGQLGNGTTTTSTLPVTVTGLTGVTGITVGSVHSCAVLSNGTARCWGNATYGKLGNGSTVTGSSVPVTVTGLTGAISISAGYGHTCAALSNGTARCWGYNGYGQLGNNALIDSSVPVTVSGLTGASSVTLGYYHSCALLTNGAARCWGVNSYGQLGDGTTTGSKVPTTVTGLTAATTITAGSTHTCAGFDNGTVRCWGANDGGQLGNGTTTNANVPVAVTGLTNAVSVTAGSAHSCALRSDGTARCWGANLTGQLGNGTITSSSVPVTVTSLTGATSISAGGHSCAALSFGGARCWGANNGGQLGNGTMTNSPVPVRVLTPRSTAESLVTAAYQDYIGRAATDPELTAGIGIVGDASSIQRRAQFTTALAQSDTYLGAVVNKLYVDTLGRVGEPGGVAYWTNELRSGRITVAQTAGLFYSSGEYFAGYGGNNLTTWVTDLYNKILHRAPDSGGLAYYVDLAQRTNRYTVAYPFYQSTESSRTRTNALYLHFLGRPADASGLDYWATRIPSLGDVALASNLTLSTEYLNRAGTRYP